VRIVEFTSLQRVRQLLYIQKAFGAPLVEFLKYFFRSESADLYDVLFIWADIFTWSPSSWFATTGKNQGPTTASKYTS